MLPALEGKVQAKACHEDGHWGHDLCKMQLHMTCFWLQMHQDVVDVITKCSTCKAFGARHIHSLLQLLTRAHT
ncbi:hypothetical protein K439DRAFT_1567591, partial [Ramaria rubella]